MDKDPSVYPFNGLGEVKIRTDEVIAREAEDIVAQILYAIENGNETLVTEIYQRAWNLAFEKRLQTEEKAKRQWRREEIERHRK